MILVKKALSIICKNTKKNLATENINTEKSLGRILAENIRSVVDNPPFNMSAMDGYAVHDNPSTGIYKVVDVTFAGKPTKKRLTKGKAIRVFTGSKLPKGTKAVIIQENIKKLEDKLIFNITKKIKLGNYIRKKGLDFKRNKIIITKSKEINSRDIALLIGANVKHVKVFKKPRITLLASGDELIVSNKKKSEGSIYASSLFMIESLINLSASKCISKKIVKDNKNIIKRELNKATKSDIIITTGGVSVGNKDLIRSSLLELGYEEKFWKIMMKPGKPLLFGVLNGTPVFSLPGNPVSSYVCFYIFVVPYLYKLFQMKKKLDIKNAKLKNNVNTSLHRESYVRGFYYDKKEITYVHALPNQDSSLLKTLSESNCLIKIPKSNKQKNKGSNVEILILPHLY